LDARVLQPATFAKRYAVPPPTYVNKDGKVCKWRDDDRIEAVRTWKAEHEGVEMLSVEHADAVETAAAVLFADERVSALLTSGTAQVWVAAEWTDKASGLTVPVKCLIDKVPAVDDPVYGKCLADLKTTKNASPRRFARDCFDFNYAVQAAWYLDLYTAATGEDRTDFCHIIQESFAPYELRSPTPLLAQRWIAAGRYQYERMLGYYCACLKSGTWPGYDQGDEWPVTEPEEWMLMSILPTFTEAAAEDEDEAEPEEVIP
jgi:hypothetical protein